MAGDEEVPARPDQPRRPEAETDDGDRIDEKKNEMEIQEFT
jgi:hypothetical protein